MSEKEVDVKNLLPLAKYLLILVESYPQPIRATVLAEKARHSKAAISKIRDRLMEICDPDLMAFEKGFVLSQNFNLIPSIFIVLLANGNHKKFLTSRFFRTFVSSQKVHDKIAAIFKPYGERFTPDETGFLIQKIAESIERLPSSDFEFLLRVLTSRKPSAVAELTSLQNVEKTIKKLEFTFKNKEEFTKTMVLRDKFFFLIRDVFMGQNRRNENSYKLGQKNQNNAQKRLQNYNRLLSERHISQTLMNLLISAGKNFGKDVEGQISIGSSHFLEDEK